MGQYWVIVNLDKKEFVHPHTLGAGLKLWEQLANHPSTGEALLILTTAMPEARGGGDFQPHPAIGRWAGDRIAVVGDYAEDADLAPEFEASKLYHKCRDETRVEWTTDIEGSMYQDGMQDSETYGLYAHSILVKQSEYKDVTHLVCQVIEDELNGKFVGNGWRTFEYK